ncbi:hypothetical protein C8F01DRAFT_1339512 [Mycena amicta]|nr:hypothetical protein C8F01DRAFT_1339512 [Mycena amicta]
MPSATVSVSSLPLALEELLQRMNEQLVSATERKSRLYADLEAANTREPNEPAMDVLRSRLKLSEEVVAMKIKVVEDLDAKATPDELVETRRLITLCESLAVERTDGAITSKKPTKTGRQDRSLAKKPMQRIAEVAPKPSSVSAPPTRTRAAAANSSSSAAETSHTGWSSFLVPPASAASSTTSPASRPTRRTRPSPRTPAESSTIGRTGFVTGGHTGSVITCRLAVGWWYSLPSIVNLGLALNPCHLGANDRRQPATPLAVRGSRLVTTTFLPSLDSETIQRLLTSLSLSESAPSDTPVLPLEVGSAFGNDPYPDLRHFHSRQE